MPRIESMSIESTSPISAWVRWKVSGSDDVNYEKIDNYDVMYHAHENRGVVIQENTKGGLHVYTVYNKK